MGRLLISAGVILIGLGVLVVLLERVHVGLGRLPGDIIIRSKNTTFYFPIVTCILLSALGTLLMWLFNRK